MDRGDDLPAAAALSGLPAVAAKMGAAMTEQQKMAMAMQNPAVREEWERLRDAAPEMLDLLRELEKDECPWCGADSWAPIHAPDCKLAALLARFPR